MATRAWGEGYRTTTVCVDSYQNGVLNGRFYNPYLEGGQSFQSLMQFLLGMEQVLDTMDFPKSFTATRTFADPPVQLVEAAQGEYHTGDLATFTVRILFRQNASWQGSITWLEGRQEQSFRSVLELILLLDNALQQADATE